MPAPVDIGAKAASDWRDQYTSPADRLVLARMVERYGLAAVLAELGTLAGDIGEEASGKRRQSLLGINRRLFDLSATAAKAEAP